jgi:polysaccharide export outer membrane protein
MNPFQLKSGKSQMTSSSINNVFAAVGRPAVCFLVCLCSALVAPAQESHADSAARMVDSGTAAFAVNSVTRDSVSSPLLHGNESGASLLIGPADVLVIDVWKEPELSRTIPVRPDGKISLPLIGELQASSLTPSQLQEEISQKLQKFISEPEVAVMVQEVKSRHFNILGQVARPGSYQLTNSMTILDAIATAGGLRDFAKRKSIYILRPNQGGTQTRIPFNYKDAIKGADPAQNIKLASLDTIIVP